MQRAIDAAQFGGSASAIVLWGLSISDIAAIVGAVVAVGGFVVNIIYKRREDRRAAELLRAKIERIKAGEEDAD
jgi:hypothetical protein